MCRILFLPHTFSSRVARIISLNFREIFFSLVSRKLRVTCIVIVLPPSTNFLAFTLCTNARSIPVQSMPLCS